MKKKDDELAPFLLRLLLHKHYVNFSLLDFGEGPVVENGNIRKEDMGGRVSKNDGKAQVSRE